MTAIILPFPTNRPTTQLTPVHLTHLDGRPWAQASFIPGDASAPWAWVARSVAQELECLEEDVGCCEGPNGEDWVTVWGLPVYVCRIGHAAAKAALASQAAQDVPNISA